MSNAKSPRWSWRVAGDPSAPWQEEPEYGLWETSARDVAEAAAEGCVGDGGYSFPLEIEVRVPNPWEPTTKHVWVYRVSEVRTVTSERLAARIE